MLKPYKKNSALQAAARVAISPPWYETCTLLSVCKCVADNYLRICIPSTTDTHRRTSHMFETMQPHDGTKRNVVSTMQPIVKQIRYTALQSVFVATKPCVVPCVSSKTPTSTLHMCRLSPMQPHVKQALQTIFLNTKFVPYVKRM